MAVYRRSSRTRYVLAVLVLAALTLSPSTPAATAAASLTTSAPRFHDAFSPLQRATHSALRPIGNFFTGALDYGSLRRENQRLRDQVAGLQAQSIQAAGRAVGRPTAVLAEQQLPFVGSIPTVSVEVIDNGSSNFENTVTVDKGTTSGIAVGQPVVAAGGLVGSVAAVSSRTATVVLLTDPTFAVGVRLDAVNVGTAQGVGRGEPLRVTVDTTSQTPSEAGQGPDGRDQRARPGEVPRQHSRRASGQRQPAARRGRTRHHPDSLRQRRAAGVPAGADLGAAVT